MAPMTVERLLSEACVASKSTLCSQKAVLNALANLLAEQCPSTSCDTVFRALLERERLGTTALNHGVAIPHAKTSGILQPTAALLTLEKPIDFGASDGLAVDIFYALLVPENPEQHLDALKHIVQKLQQDTYRQALRGASTPSELYAAALG